MFEVRIFNPFIGDMDTISTIETESLEEAKQQAGDLFFRNGIKIGEIGVAESGERYPVEGFPDQRSVAENGGGFWFVANHVFFVFKAIKEVLGIKVDSFIDLGCGPGNVLINARNLLGAARLTGVELDPALVAQARINTRDLGANIIEADLTAWQPAVNDFDMVYAYDPIRDLPLREKFLVGLAGWLRDGQYVYYHRIVGEMPAWLEKIEIPNYDVPCLYTFKRDKV
jgi:SAM-dependent methyltransferase